MFLSTIKKTQEKGEGGNTNFLKRESSFMIFEVVAQIGIKELINNIFRLEYIMPMERGHSCLIKSCLTLLKMNCFPTEV